MASNVAFAAAIIALIVAIVMMVAWGKSRDQNALLVAFVCAGIVVGFAVLGAMLPT